MTKRSRILLELGILAAMFAALAWAGGWLAVLAGVVALAAGRVAGRPLRRRLYAPRGPRPVLGGRWRGR